MYALGMSMNGEALSKGSVAYLDDASLREVGVTEGHLADARKAVERTLPKLRLLGRSAGGEGLRCTDLGRRVLYFYILINILQATAFMHLISSS